MRVLAFSNGCLGMVGMVGIVNTIPVIPVTISKLRFYTGSP